MTRPEAARSGTLIYAKDLERMARFYETLLGMRRVHADAELVVLVTPGCQLLLHAIPAPIAAHIVIGDPPSLREEQAIKPFFSVDSLAAATAASQALGGATFGPVWTGPGFRMQNAHDPEGNIVQLREWDPPTP